MRKDLVKLSTLLIDLVLVIGLGGCVGVAVKGAKYAGNQATISQNEEAAARGDAKAQYELGDAYCCSVGSIDLTHDAVKATSWLCQSARQGYAPAQYRLGRLYSGNPVEGLDIQQRAKLLIAGAPKNNALALMWLTLAVQNGHRDAAQPLAELKRDMTAQERTAGETYLAEWQGAPCEWKQVFAGK
jgi:TPR repeat protein